MPFGEARDLGFNNPGFVVANQVVVVGPGDGVFIYNGIPAFGNPPVAWGVAPLVTTDPFGNSLPTDLGGWGSQAAPGSGPWAQVGGGLMLLSDTLAAAPLFTDGQVRQIQRLLSTDNPVTAVDSASADANHSHASMWLIGANPAGPPTAGVQVFFFGFNETVQIPVQVGVLGSFGFGTFASGLPTINRSVWIPPSGDTSGVTDTALINNFLTAGCNTITLQPGTFYVKTGSVTIGLDQYIWGTDKTATIVKAVDNGVFQPVFNIENSGTYSTNRNAGIGYMTLDGTGTTQAIGLEVGDIVGIEIRELAIKNFTGASGGKGLYGNNRHYWTEQARGTVYIENCTALIAFDVNGGTDSFDRWGVVHYIDAQDGQDAVQFLGGATGVQIVGGEFAMFGNFAPGAGTGHVFNLNLGGTNGGFIKVHFNVNVECTGTVGTGPQTIDFAGTGGFSETTGTINFVPATVPFQQSNNVGQFQHNGQITGDPSLVQTEFTGGSNETITANGQTVFSVAGSVINLIAAGAFTGLVVQPGSVRGQKLTVINTSAFTQTLAATNLGTGAVLAISPGTKVQYVWNNSTALWY